MKDKEHMATSTSTRKKKSPSFYGKVLRMTDGKLYIEVERKLNQLGPDNLYSIEFLHTRLPYQMSRQALQYAQSQMLQSFLFPTGPFGNPIGEYNSKRYFETINFTVINIQKSELVYRKKCVNFLA